MTIMLESEVVRRMNEVTKLALGQDYFNRVGLLINEITQSDYTFITRLGNENKIAVPTVSIKAGEIIENVSYSLKGTPCYEVTQTCSGYFRNDVQHLFPEDELLQIAGIDGYLGVSLVGHQNTPFAIITCLYEISPTEVDEISNSIEFIGRILENRIEREYLLMRNYELKVHQKEQNRKLIRRDILLKEIHHRVKNNLQIVASMLNLWKIKTEDELVIELVETSKDRIQSIALVHELLYGSDDFERVDISDYVAKIVENTIYTKAIPNLTVKVNVEHDLVNVDILIPCGLILCEAVVNFFKYGLSDHPIFEIRYFRESGVRKLVISDNGPGFDEQVLKVGSDSLGIDLIYSLVEQINGQVQLYNKNGAVIEIILPKGNPF